ncbi:MAG: Crp/Fnr family transcriptional regulator [Elusimicrobia bacterium]|nr:Crp/Fnr family transcriptional regulator [Elusimicrobiota bacterium]
MTISQLVRFKLLSTLPRKHLQRIRALAVTRDFEAGQQIFSKADTAHHIFFVVSGQVKIFCQSASRKRKTFAYFGPGDIFGEMGVLLDTSRSASAVSVAKSRLLILSTKDFRRFLLSDPGVTLKLLKTVAERLRFADEEIESLLFRNILGRVSKAVHDLGCHHGVWRRRGLVLRQRYTHQELADLVGTTREPLSRALASLRRAGLLEMQEGRIRIPNPKKLESLIRTSAGNS